MRWVSLFGLVVVGFCLSSGLQAGGKKGESLEGTWVVKSFITDGKKAPDKDIIGKKLVIKKNTYEIFQDKNLLGKGTFKMDAAKNPKTIDVTAMTPDGKKVPSVVGIYKLEKDTLIVCGVKEGMKRPTDFTCKEGSQRQLIIYERKK